MGEAESQRLTSPASQDLMAGSSRGAAYLSPWRRYSLSWAAENLSGSSRPLRRHALRSGMQPTSAPLEFAFQRLGKPSQAAMLHHADVGNWLRMLRCSGLKHRPHDRDHGKSCTASYRLMQRPETRRQCFHGKMRGKPAVKHREAGVW